MQARLIERLLRSARGEDAPDRVIRNGRIVNVFTNSIDDDMAISIKDGYITGIAAEEGFRTTGRTEVVDAGGRYLCPGFIDGHTHLDSVNPFYAMVPYALRGGTTCVVSETAMVGTACGAEAVECFMDSTKGYPLRCYFLVPPERPPFPDMETGVGFGPAAFGRLLRREDVLGVGEAYWTRMIEGDGVLLRQAARAMSLRKTLEGHAAGAKGEALVQYLLTGITSDHESITCQEAIEKLRLGVHIMIREGFVRKELEELSKLKDTEVDKRRLMLVSDIFDAVTLCEEGYLDTVVRRAVGLGFSPMEAIKMATVNVAEYYGLRHLGAIAPLRHADILFLDDLEAVSVAHVMANGEMVVTDGEFTGQARPYPYPEAMKQTLKTEKLDGEDFRIKAIPGKKRVRLVRMVNETITREAEAALSVKDGYLEKDLEKDIVPVAVIYRGSGKRMGKGFITGTGLKEGAFATDVSWDACNIVTAGSSEADMAKAVNRLIELQGGYVISRKGEIIYELAMPVFGLLAEAPLDEISRRIKEIDAAMKAIGSVIPRPFLALQTIPFTGLPFLRITDRGLADIRGKRLVPLYID